MKEFVILNKSNEVIERATLKENLSKLNQPNISLIEFEGDFLIGDKIVNGKIIPMENEDSERGVQKSKRGKRKTLINSIKVKLNLNDEELEALTEKV